MAWFARVASVPMVLALAAPVGCGPSPAEEPLPLSDAPPKRQRPDDGSGGVVAPPTPKTAPVVSVLADKQGRPRGVAADEAFVYYASLDDKAIYRVPTIGGAVTRVDTPGTAISEPWVHAVDGMHVYFANTDSDGHGSLARVRKTGGRIETLIGDVHPWSVVLDSDNVYFTNSPVAGQGSLQRVAKACVSSCNAVVLASAQEYPLGLAVDGGFVYWANQAANVTYAYPGGPEISRVWAGTLRRTSISASAPSSTSTTLLAGLKNPAGVAIGGGRLFVSTTEDRAVRSVDASGNDVKELSSDAGTPYFMVADDMHVYWLSGGASTEGATLFRSAKDRSSSEPIATGQRGPVGLAITNDAVYWTNLTGGQVMRASK